MSKRGRMILALVIGGGALYYVWRRSSQQQAATAPIVNVQGGGGGGLTGLGATLGGALSAIPHVGPVVGGVVGVGGALLDQYAALDPAQKAQVKALGEKVDTAWGGSARRDRRSKRTSLIEQLTYSRGQREGAESHAMKVLSLAGRPDVEWWQIEQDGSTTIKYRYNPEAFKLPVPFYADHPTAWAYELTSRIYGAPVSAGRGPIVGSFDTFDVAGFYETNPLAPKRYTLGEAAKFEEAQLAAIAKKHR